MSELVDKALPTAASDGSVEEPEPEPEVLKAADAANEAEGEKVSPVEAEAEKETEEEVSWTDCMYLKRDGSWFVCV